MFSVFLCWFEVLTSHKSLPFKNCRVNLSLAKLHLLETLNLFKSVAAAAKSQRTFWGTQLEIEFQAALKHLFHKTMSLVRLQDSQSYLELWLVHCGLPTGCFFFFKSASMTGPFSLCVTRPVWGLMGFTCTVMLPLCEELALGRVVMDCRFGRFWNQCLGRPFWRACALSVHLGPISSLSLTTFYFLNGAYGSVRNSQKTKLGTEGLGRKYWVWLLEISGENEPVKSTGTYLSILLLWQAFKNKTSTLGYFGTLWIRLWYPRVSSVDGMKGKGLRKENSL